MLGYEKYSSSTELVTKLNNINATASLSSSDLKPNKTTPVYWVSPRTKTDTEIHITSRIKKARLNFRSYDPEELGRMSAGEAIDSIAQALGVVSVLLPSERQEAAEHNYRAAFVAGLTMGLEKPLLLLQYGEDPIPLDYRHLVKVFRSPSQIQPHINEFATEIAGLL